MAVPDAIRFKKMKYVGSGNDSVKNMYHVFVKNDAGIPYPYQMNESILTISGEKAI